MIQLSYRDLALRDERYGPWYSLEAVWYLLADMVLYSNHIFENTFVYGRTPWTHKALRMFL